MAWTRDGWRSETSVFDLKNAESFLWGAGKGRSHACYIVGQSTLTFFR